MRRTILALTGLVVLGGCPPRAGESAVISPAQDGLSHAGAGLGLSSFQGDALGNLRVGETTFREFLLLVPARSFDLLGEEVVFSYPEVERARTELQSVSLRFSPPGPNGDEILQELTLLLIAKPEELDLVLARLGDDFDEVRLPLATNRYGELAAATYLSKQRHFAVDMDKVGIRIRASLPWPE